MIRYENDRIKVGSLDYHWSTIIVVFVATNYNRRKRQFKSCRFDHRTDTRLNSCPLWIGGCSALHIINRIAASGGLLKKSPNLQTHFPPYLGLSSSSLRRHRHGQHLLHAHPIRHRRGPGALQWRLWDNSSVSSISPSDRRRKFPISIWIPLSFNLILIPSRFLPFLVFVVSQQEIVSLYQRFCQLDRNGGGFIAAEEFLSVPEFAVNPLSQVLNSLLFSLASTLGNFDMYESNLKFSYVRVWFSIYTVMKISFSPKKKKKKENIRISGNKSAIFAIIDVVNGWNRKLF